MQIIPRKHALIAGLVVMTFVLAIKTHEAIDARAQLPMPNSAAALSALQNFMRGLAQRSPSVEIYSAGGGAARNFKGISITDDYCKSGTPFCTQDPGKGAHCVNVDPGNQNTTFPTNLTGKLEGGVMTYTYTDTCNGNNRLFEGHCSGTNCEETDASDFQKPGINTVRVELNNAQPPSSIDDLWCDREHPGTDSHCPPRTIDSLEQIPQIGGVNTPPKGTLPMPTFTIQQNTPTGATGIMPTMNIGVPGTQTIQMPSFTNPMNLQTGVTGAQTIQVTLPSTVPAPAVNTGMPQTQTIEMPTFIPIPPKPSTPPLPSIVSPPSIENPQPQPVPPPAIPVTGTSASGNSSLCQIQAKGRTIRYASLPSMIEVSAGEVLTMSIGAGCTSISTLRPIAGYEDVPVNQSIRLEGFGITSISSPRQIIITAPDVNDIRDINLYFEGPSVGGLQSIWLLVRKPTGATATTPILPPITGPAMPSNGSNGLMNLPTIR